MEEDTVAKDSTPEPVKDSTDTSTEETEPVKDSIDTSKEETESVKDSTDTSKEETEPEKESKETTENSEKAESHKKPEDSFKNFVYLAEKNEPKKRKLDESKMSKDSNKNDGDKDTESVKKKAKMGDDLKTLWTAVCSLTMGKEERLLKKDKFKRLALQKAKEKRSSDKTSKNIFSIGANKSLEANALMADDSNVLRLNFALKKNMKSLRLAEGLYVITNYPDEDNLTDSRTDKNTEFLDVTRDIRLLQSLKLTNKQLGGRTEKSLDEQALWSFEDVVVKSENDTDSAEASITVDVTVDTSYLAPSPPPPLLTVISEGDPSGLNMTYPDVRKPVQTVQSNVPTRSSPRGRGRGRRGRGRPSTRASAGGRGKAPAPQIILPQIESVYSVSWGNDSNKAPSPAVSAEYIVPTENVEQITPHVQEILPQALHSASQFQSARGKNKSSKLDSASSYPVQLQGTVLSSTGLRQSARLGSRATAVRSSPPTAIRSPQPSSVRASYPTAIRSSYPTAIRASFPTAIRSSHPTAIRAASQPSFSGGGVRQMNPISSGENGVFPMMLEKNTSVSSKKFTGVPVPQEWNEYGSNDSEMIVPCSTENDPSTTIKSETPTESQVEMSNAYDYGQQVSFDPMTNPSPGHKKVQPIAQPIPYVNAESYASGSWPATSYVYQQPSSKPYNLNIPMMKKIIQKTKRNSIHTTKSFIDQQMGCTPSLPSWHQPQSAPDSSDK